MRLLTLLMSFLLLSFAGCSSLKIDVDHDMSFDFPAVKKYAIVHKDREGDNTLINDRIIVAIKSALDANNFSEVKKEQADLIFVFHVNVIQMSDIRTDYQVIGYDGYRYGAGWGYGGYGGYGAAVVVPNTTTYRWTEAKIIVDALNPKTKKIVWRGIATDEITRGNYTAQEKSRYVNSVISKLMKQFLKLSTQKKS